MTLAEERLDFRVAVLAVDQGCVVHDDPADCGGRVEVHHVITRQQLRHAGRDDLAWDPLNGASICDRAHDRHHLGYQRIPFERLPERCVAFAERHGFQRLLERYYPRRTP